MSQFKDCVEAIRHQGLDDTAEIVSQLAANKPKLFAAVSIGQTNYGDELTGLSSSPRVFLTRKSANREVDRLTCEYLRSTPLSDLLERFEMESHQVDVAYVSEELTRILGVPTRFPGPEVQYWNDARCKKPLLPAGTSDEKTIEIARLLKLKLFKVASVPCDVHLKTPPASSPRHRPSVRSSSGVSSGGGGILSWLPWRRR